MIKYMFFFIALASCMCLNAQDVDEEMKIHKTHSLKVGVKIQKTHFMYWENGISAQYSFANFKNGQFYLGLDYVTSRLGSAFNSNALKQDSYIGSIAWHFFSKKSVHLITKVNVGYFHASLGDELFNELPNTEKLLSPELGLSYDFKNRPIVINLGTGYNISLKSGGESPGTLQPLFYNLAIYYKLK